MKPPPSKSLALLVALLSFLTVLYLPTTSVADRALRCRGRLVHIGDFEADVISRCGEPDHIERWEELPDGHRFKFYDYKNDRYQLPERIRGPIQFERWTYDLEANRFTRYLFFENGELYKIERGDK